MIDIPRSKEELKSLATLRARYMSLVRASIKLREYAASLNDEILLDFFVALTEGNGEDTCDILGNDDDDSPSCFEVVIREMESEVDSRDLNEAADRMRISSRCSGLRPGYASLMESRQVHSGPAPGIDKRRTH